MTENKTSGGEIVVQEHCIDLPGESVQCWIGGGTDKLKVILRKHRDVIFDVRVGDGKTYTVESTESDFYSPRDKKLFYAARRNQVTFKDGERLHIWVSRGFRGALVLKCGSHVISEITPNEWDMHRHSDDPQEKPAPIIFALTAPPSANQPRRQKHLKTKLSAPKKNRYTYTRYQNQERPLQFYSSSKMGENRSPWTAII